ncbi:bifunctional metallophosphatase/5'-nucleotidase [Halorubrum sp. SP3]|uniref:bifunctional metallophosphatase/5'-nucleotidase n=1 Tax=unclassified Halorubrum TaxID=2642239 RepID=UPI0010F532FC|nr:MULTISPECIES: bifunctional UDP-sugar hydrolase/5'-nucleotidase [unclassified Halorubrum]TKX55928.1 bifunctional metallophosphatase/5'-nucleotidase [Halorubrum sp. SP3]TKX71612.1 bifunctional metallophosphatase/5'-nucleotidase [Halorubrum sp. SP9]
MLRAGGIVLGGSLVSGSTTAADDDGPTTLTLLSYNDVQTAAAEDKDFPRLVTLIEQRRAAADGPVVVVGGGDQIGPHALSPISQWRAPVDVLNGVQPDADVIGNHEFDYGLDAISDVTADSKFPWLATNLVDSETGEAFDGTKSNHIVERGGVRVGIIGLADKGATTGKTNIDFEAEGITIEDYTETGPAEAKRLREEEGVDVVVALAHTGVPDAEALAEADTDDDIDVLVVGDDEIVYRPTEQSGTIVSEAEARANYLSEIELTVEDGSVTSWEGDLLEVTDDIEKDPDASRIINEYRAEVSLDSPVVESAVPLDATFSSNYHRETNYGNLITDAMRERTDADVAITNAGGIRSDSVYGPGEITGGDIFNTLPFPNTVVSLELTGEELVETLESQVVTLESATGQSFGEEISQQTSGLRFEWVPHEDADELIRDVYVGGEPLDLDETYEVAVNSFIANGGSGYPLEDKPVIDDTGELQATTVVDYLEPRETIAPTVEGRMQRVDRDLPDASVTVDGNGKVVTQFDAPDDVRSVAEDTVAVWTPEGDHLDAEHVAFGEGDETLVVRVDDGDLADTIEDADDGDEIPLNLYAEYESSEFDHIYFERSRLNADVTATVRERGRGRGRGRVGPPGN